TSSVTANASAYLSNRASSRINRSRSGMSASIASLTRMSDTAPPAWGSTFPEEFRRSIDLCRQAFVHRTVQRSLLEYFAIRRVGRQRNVNLRWQSHDPSRSVLRHLLFHGHGHSAKIDPELLRFNPHGRAHTSPKCSRNKIGR